jgi:hypothetical protein
MFLVLEHPQGGAATNYGATQASFELVNQLVVTWPVMPSVIGSYEFVL